jgi:hypothetical protein
MKRTLIILNIAMLFLLFFQSCSKDDTYTSLTTEAKDLLFYEAGDTFQLRNLATDEIITLTVNSKSFDYYRDTNPGWWLGRSGGDDYYEYGQFNFADDTNCYNGSFYVEALSNENFELSAYIGECFGNVSYSSYDFQGEIIPFIIVNNIEYTNVYLIRSYSQIIYYSNEKGIIQIVNSITQETQFVIVD